MCSSDLIANAAASVTVNSSPADYRRGEYFQELVSVNNSSTSVWQNVSVATSGGGTNTGNVFVPTATETYGYDADGNMTNDGRWTFTWDAENRLVSMQAMSTVPSGAKKKLDFTYDYGGRRNQKIVSTWNGSAYVPASTNKFLYDGWNLMAELNSTNGIIRTYIWGLDLSGTIQGAGGVGGLLVIKPASGNPSFVAYDGNGNVTGLIDATTGTTSGQFEYGPFGATIRLTPNSNNQSPFRFSTKYADDESDFLYYGYRYYNPSTGRWLSRDPLGEATSLNLTSFLDNNSVNAHDVLGLYNSAGHFYTTYLVARAAGFADDPAFQFAYWSQYPDQNLDFSATERALNADFAVGEYLHSLTGGDAKKLRSYLSCLLKSDQFNDSEKGMLIHALGDAYAHSYIDWNSWQGSPRQGRPNPDYRQEMLYPPPFGHFFSGHMPDYIGSKPGPYGNYVDQLYGIYGILSGMNDGGTTHPEWVSALKDQANTFSKPNFVPDFLSTKDQNPMEVDALRNLPGGYNGSAHDYDPDDRTLPRTLPGMERDPSFRDKLINKIKNGVKCCVLKK